MYKRQVIDGKGFVGRWPGGFGAWDIERRNQANPKKKKQKAKATPGTKTSGDKPRSASTLRHLLKENEKLQAKLAKQKESLTKQLEEAGDDYEALGTIGAELGEIETQINAAEEAWLELESERESAS